MIEVALRLGTLQTLMNDIIPGSRLAKHSLTNLEITTEITKTFGTTAPNCGTSNLRTFG